MADWNLLSEQYCPAPSTQFPLHVPQSSQLLPHSFITLLQQRYNHYITSQRSKYSQSSSQNQNNLTTQLILQTIQAIQQLRQHYQLLLSNKQVLTAALSPVPTDSVLRLQPEVHSDFVHFVSSLCQPASSFKIDDQQIRQIIQWEQDLRKDDDILTTSVQTNTNTLNTLEDSFQLFHTSWNKILDLYLTQNEQ